MSAPLTLHKARYTGALVQPLHQHDALQLSMVLTGAVEETVGGITYTGAPLHIAVKDAGVAHANRWAPGGAQLVRLEAHGQSPRSLPACPRRRRGAGGSIRRPFVRSCALLLATPSPLRQQTAAIPPICSPPW